VTRSFFTHLDITSSHTKLHLINQTSFLVDWLTTWHRITRRVGTRASPAGSSHPQNVRLSHDSKLRRKELARNGNTFTWMIRHLKLWTSLRFERSSDRGHLLYIRCQAGSQVEHHQQQPSQLSTSFSFQSFTSRSPEPASLGYFNSSI
jgi:hypothetical protein